MARVCEITGKHPTTGSIIWRSGKAKKKGGIGMHVTSITKRRFLPNIQKVKAVVDGKVTHIRVSTRALKRGLIVKPPKRDWKKTEAPDETTKKN
jgi:large subunit ribosomal protein L28